MRTQAEKDNFIMMRAQGKSYAVISKELGISKSTCTQWERELKDAIADKKEEELNALYDEYFMTREARISKLGEQLQQIDTLIKGADMHAIPPDKLLDYKLKYTQALKDEYIPTGKPAELAKAMSGKGIMEAYTDLLKRVQAGEVSNEQANRENMILANMLKTYETTELAEKVQALEAVIGGR